MQIANSHLSHMGSGLYLSVVVIYLCHVIQVTSVTSLTCTRWPDIKVKVGVTWSERCRQCQCGIDGQTSCTEPTCTHKYHPSQEDNCDQWSSNSCCCEQVVCRHGDKKYKLGTPYPVHERETCRMCTCTADPGDRECSVVDCGTLECVDHVETPDHCCPSCPNGKNCRLPPLDWPKHGDIAPVTSIPFNTSKIIFNTLNFRFAYSCTCKIPGFDAECSKQARLFHMGVIND